MRRAKPTLGLSRAELAALRRLSTPIKIQDFLDRLPTNFERRGETIMSPRRVLRERKAHCIEGAMLAAAALWVNGEKPLLLDLKGASWDEDHVVALYRRGGRWGAISKTNHATLRFRDPIYKSVRELAASYFHEYFSNALLRKSLRSYAGPFDMRRLGRRWLTAEKDLWGVDRALGVARHLAIFPRGSERFLRRPDAMERRAGKLAEWRADGRRA